MHALNRVKPEDDRLDQYGTLAMRHRHLEWRMLELEYETQPQARLVVTRDRSGPIAAIHKAAKAVCADAGPVVVMTVATNGLAKLTATTLGKVLLGAFRNDFELIALEYQLYHFSPVYMLMRRFRRFLPKNLPSDLNMTLPTAEAEKLVFWMERVVDILRRRLKRPELKQAQQNFRRNAIANFNGLCDALDWLAQMHSWVMVLRFDLFMRAEGSQPPKFGDKPDISLLDEFRSSCKRFHLSVDRQFDEGCLGYAWTLEHGRESGFHKHYVVILKLDGDKDHVAIVDGLARKWEKLTGGRGWLHNCNSDPARYLRRAVGVVDLHDPETVEGLRYIAAYFTLAGLYCEVDRSLVPCAFHPGRFPKGPVRTTGRPHKRSPGYRTALVPYEHRHVNFM